MPPQLGMCALLCQELGTTVVCGYKICDACVARIRAIAIDAGVVIDEEMISGHLPYFRRGLTKGEQRLADVQERRAIERAREVGLMPLYARLWVDILGDPKLRMAVRQGKKHLIVLPWFFAWAKRADAEGRIEIDGKPADPRVIADEIPNATPRLVAKSLQELADIGILTKDPDGAYRFRSWEFRNSGRASDSKDAIAERVRKHREKKRAGRNEGSNASNALQGVTDVTTVTTQRVESREEREESKRVKSKKRSSSERVSLPPAAVEFGRRFYATASPSRKREVTQQLRATLNGGAAFKRGVTVYAGSVERLEAKCREVIAEGVRNRDRAIVVLLRKLADVSDDSPTERAAVELHQTEQRDATDTAQRLADAYAWLANHPDVAKSIDHEIDATLDAQTPSPAGKMREMTHRMLQRSAVLNRWTDAGAPTGEPLAAIGGGPTS